MTTKSHEKRGIATRLGHAGRDPAKTHGFINPPVYRGSTVLFPTLDALEAGVQDYTYGRHGTPTGRALEQALAGLDGAARCWLTPSGLAAIGLVLLAFVRTGDHVVIADSVYAPTRRFCDNILARMGIETTYYDPLIGSGIKAMLRANTRIVFMESPGSQTFEMQDIPAIAEAARRAGAVTVMDNTWATPLYFRPLEHGVDVAIQAATKYLVGHADALLGVITATDAMSEAIDQSHRDLGLCAGPDDVSLTLRALRTLEVRLARHYTAALEIARWLEARPEVTRVLYPALPSHPQHALWKRDFSGASGLFSIVLRPASRQAVAAMLDGLDLFGMGWSWGGYESLILPFNASPQRTATRWIPEGPALRLHIGLEDVEDLKADLSEGFARLRASA